MKKYPDTFSDTFVIKNKNFLWKYLYGDSEIITNNENKIVSDILGETPSNKTSILQLEASYFVYCNYGTFIKVSIKVSG